MSDYDAIASFYAHRWCEHFYDSALRMLQPFLSGLQPGSNLLDVCCGSGRIASAVRVRGHRVTCFDGSMGLLQYADAPKVQADARALPFGSWMFDGAYATFDILNHLLTEDDATALLREVRYSLRPGSEFFFDVLLEDAYREGWTREATVIEPEFASYVRGGYDAVSQMAFTDITLFEQLDADCWTRADTRVRQRYYPPPRIESMAYQAGYTAVTFRKLTGADDFSFGRAAFRATAP